MQWNRCEIILQTRLAIIICIFFISFLIIVVRLISVAHVKQITNTRQNNNVSAYRKEILDRNAIALATNALSTSLWANLSQIEDKNKLISKLSKILTNFDKKQILQAFDAQKKFLWIKHDLTKREKYDIFNLGMKGLNLEKHQRRIYPYHNLTSHIVGYVGRDFYGLAGLEKSYEDFLSSNNSYKDSNIEEKLELSIDIRLQQILSEELDEVISKFSAKGATAIIANPNNGEILGLVSKPDFNPYLPNKATQESLFNKASLGVYELGSVFKTLAFAIAFDTKTITMEDVYDITYMKIGNFILKDLIPRRGWNTVPQIFLYSSNIGISQIILEVGKENMYKYFQKLGLFNQINIELPERGKPLFTPRDQIQDLNLVTISYGYSISITPLHFIQSVIPMVNGGTLYPLTLLKNPGISKGEKVFSKSTSDNMKALFRLTVQEGTGRKAEVPGYYPGGKTGTAEKLGNGKYLKNSRVASFIGTFPISKPQYLIFIMVDDPKGIKETNGWATGGWVAAPVAANIIKKIVSLYGILALDKNDPDIQNITNIEFKIKNEI
ncbi:MAG: peptidoglycan D,D-transpeptidase FtsI family protein [Rickettsiaceae bacterium]